MTLSSGSGVVAGPGRWTLVPIIVVFTMSAISGCASVKEAVTFDRTLAYDQIIDMVNTQASKVQTFSAEGSLSINSPRMAQTAGFEVHVRRPDSVKIVVSGPFGITVGEALFTKDRFVAYSPLQNTLYNGNTSVSTGFMGTIDVPPAVVLDALTGVRNFDAPKTYPDSFYVTRSFYIAKFSTPKGWSTYTVDPVSGHIVEVERNSNDNKTTEWRETYSYTKNENNEWQPVTTEIDIPAKKLHISIDYSAVHYNRPLPSLFIAYPNDAERVTIE